MSVPCRFIGCALALILLAGATPAPAQAPRLDANGKALPPGALARLGASGSRHQSAITSLGFTGTKHRLLARSDDSDVRLWDVAANKDFPRWPVVGSPHRERLGLDQILVLSRDGKVLAYQSNGAVVVEDADTEKQLLRLSRAQLARDAKIKNADLLLFQPSADGTWLVVQDTSFPGRVGVWRTATGELVRAWEFADKGHGVRAVALSDDGATLTVFDEYAPDGKQQIRRFDVATGKQVGAVSLPAKQYQFLRLLDGGKTLAARSLTSNVAVHLLDATTGKELRSFETGNGVLSAATSADGKRLLGVCQSRSVVWEVATGKELWRTPAVKGESWEPVAALAPDGATVAVAQATGFRVWDVDSGKQVGLLAGHKDGVLSVAFAPRGGRVVTTTRSGALVWDTTTARPVLELPFAPGGDDDRTLRDFILIPGRYNAIRAVFTPDGKTVAALVLGQPLQRWDAATGKPLPPWPHAPQKVSGFAYSPDGKLLALTAGGGGVRLVHPTTGKTLRQFGTLLDVLNNDGRPNLGGTAFSVDGRTVLTFSFAVERDNLESSILGLEVWTGQPRLRLQTTMDQRKTQQIDLLFEFVSQMVAALVVSPDGQLVAVVSFVGINVWDLPRGREVRQFGGQGLNPATAVFSPDSKHLLAGKKDGSVRVWDVATGVILGDLPAHKGAVTALAFAPDGKVLASASADQTVLLWDWAAVRKQVAAAPQEEAQTPAELWQALAGNDGNAQEAVRALTTTPGPTVAFLKGQLKPVPPVAPARLKQLLDDLDSKQFAVREQATKELEALADLAGAALDERLEGKVSLEAQRRLEALREKLDGAAPAPQVLRALRAVEVLERIGTPEARQVLEALAKGAAGHRLTEEAAASVRRLAQRP
jgi:WD40 repeat protein